MEINAELRDKINAFYENAHTEAIKIITQYKKGFVSTEEMELRIRSFYLDNFFKLLKNGEFVLSIDESNWNAFLSDYNKRGNANYPDNRHKKPYLLDFHTEGRTSVSEDVKVLFFENIKKFTINIDYFKPIPSQYHKPEYTTTGYNGCTVWKITGIVDDDGFSIDKNPIGKAYTMFDKYGLKTTLEIIEEADQHQREHSGLTYRGIGTIEGYTAIRPREIYVEKLRKSGIRLVYYLDHENDIEDAEAFGKFPLWQDYFKFCAKGSEFLSEGTDRFMESCYKEACV